MRFGNGAWAMLPDVTPTYLCRVDNFHIADDEVVLHVSSVLEKARWATLQGHMFTVRVTSPLDDVLRIQVIHYKGRRQKKLHFDLADTPTPLKAEESADSVTIEAGRLRLVVTKQPWSMTFFDSVTGERVTSSPYKAMGLMDKQGHGWFLREQLTLDVGEQVYGLGERFAAFVRNGQTVDMWNSDCGTCSDKGYKDVPFFLTSKGYGVLVNTPARTSSEIGTEQVTRAQFAVPGHDLLMMRPMMLEFPEDPTSRTLDRQYLLGEALLVAPVFHDSQAEYYLPQGTWTHLLTGEVREGSRWYFDRLDFFGLPLWIRPNSLIAFGPEATQVEYDYRKDVRLVCGMLDGSSPSSVELVDARGERTSRFTLEQRGHEVSVVSEDGRADFQIALPWAKEVRDLEGGRIHEATSEVGPAPAGLVIAATSSRVRFTWL